MGSDSHDPRYAPPQAHVEDVPLPAAGLQPASRASRFWAILIDIGLTLAVELVLARFTPFDVFEENDDMFALEPRSAAIGFAVLLLLNGWLLVRRGQTIGKALMRIRIVRPDGAPASAWRVIGLRYGIGSAVAIVPGLAMLYVLVDSLLIFRASRRCLHDDIADTIVARA